jgi:L-lactate utilization protein LutC
MKTWNAAASRSSIDKTLKALNENSIETTFAANAEEAKRMVLSMIPEGSEVLTMTSITLDTIGVAKELNESGRFNSLRGTFAKMSSQSNGKEMRKLGAGPDFTVGSAHAVTETGTVLVASNTGSQLPAYAYGGGTVILVVGAQKIVPDVEEGMKRIDDYLITKESERARKAYGLPETWNTSANKILMLNRESQPGRLKLIIVNEVLGN